MQIFIFWMCMTGSYASVAVLASGEEFRNDCRRAWAFLTCRLRQREDVSRPAVLVHDGSHPSSDTDLNETPIFLIVVEDKCHISRTPSAES
jgi:hypothetical protein